MESRVLVVRERGDEAVHPALIEQTQVGEVVLVLPPRVGEDDAVVGGVELLFDDVDPLGDGGIEDVVDHHADSARVAAAEPGSHQVRLVADLGDGGHDALTQVVADVGIAVEDARHRGGCHPSALGDLANRGHGLSPSSSPGALRPPEIDHVNISHRYRTGHARTRITTR